MSQQPLRRLWRDLGLCGECGDAAIDDGPYCSACRDYQRDYARRRYEQRRADGQCGCGRQAIEGLSYCTECRANAALTERDQAPWFRRLRRVLADAGLCLWCRAPTRPSRALCEACLAVQRERYQSRAATGRCTRCGAPASGWACDPCRAAHNEARRRRKEVRHG